MQRKQKIVYASVLVAAALAWWLFLYEGNETEIPEAKSVHETIDAAYTRILKSAVFPVTKEKLIEGAVSGMTETLGDPYSKYMTKAEAKAHHDSLADERVGIGIELMEKKGRILVVTPLKSSPAEKAGIKPFDEIVRINGEGIGDKSFPQVMTLLRGDKGSRVKLTVYRPDENRHVEMEIERQVMKVATVTSEIIKKDNRKIGYVVITTFAEKTADEWLEQTKMLVDKGIDGLLIDVRGNPGGYLHSVQKIAGTLLPNGAVFAFMQDSKGVMEPLATAGGNDAYAKTMRKLPVVLLQNKGSASASELLSGALQANRRALIAGTTSFGKGTVQETWKLPNGGELKLSTHKWLTPREQWIHGKGIEADFKIDQNELFGLVPLPVSETYEAGSFHSDVAYAQKALSAIGYSVGRQDGYFDEGTQLAVQAFHEKELNNSSPIMDVAFFSKLRKVILSYKEGKEHDDQYQMALSYLVHSIR